MWETDSLSEKGDDQSKITMDIMIPGDMVGFVIGPNGCIVKKMEARFGVTLYVIQKTREWSRQEKRLRITGPRSNVETAVHEITESVNRKKKSLTALDAGPINVALGGNVGLVKRASEAPDRKAKWVRRWSHDINGQTKTSHIVFTVDLDTNRFTVAPGDGQFVSSIHADIQVKRSDNSRYKVEWTGGNGRVVVPLSDAQARLYPSGRLVMTLHFHVTKLDDYFAAQDKFADLRERLLAEVNEGMEGASIDSDNQKSVERALERKRANAESDSVKSEQFHEVNHSKTADSTDSFGKLRNDSYATAKSCQDDFEDSTKSPEQPNPTGDSTNMMTMFDKGPFIKDDFTNCSIRVRDSVFYVHFSVLGAQSSVLKKELKSAKSMGKSMELMDENPADVLLFLEGIYSRKSISRYANCTETLATIHRLSRRFKAQGILEYCESLASSHCSV